MIDLRCIGAVGSGAGCHELVDQERGGAWCAEHRPADLTGERWDPARLTGVRTGDHRTRVWSRGRRGAA